MLGDVGQARTNAAMLLLMIAGTLSHTCTKPIVNTIVFTNTKTWLVVKPMTTALDLKIYSELIKTKSKYPNKMAYHIRIKSENEIDNNLLELLRIGYDYTNK